MILPASIKVGPYHWTISTDPGALSEIRRERDSGRLVGQSDFHTLRILLDATCQEDLIAETLLHEVLHVAWDQVLPSGRVDDETAIRALSPLLLDVLRANPALVAALIGGGVHAEGES